MSNLLSILISQLLIPEIAKLLAARQAAGQPPPTAAELRAELVPKADAFLHTGRAFLLSHGINPDALDE